MGKSTIGILLTLCLVPSTVLGAAEGVDAGDTAWILTSTALGLFMTLPGLALSCGGLVNRKSKKIRFPAQGETRCASSCTTPLLGWCRDRDLNPDGLSPRGF